MIFSAGFLQLYNETILIAKEIKGSHLAYQQKLTLEIFNK